jgi:HNH endonuclease
LGRIGEVEDPAFFSRGATVDHVEPIAAGGDSSVDNLVTACWPCDSCKRDWPLSRLRWRLREIPPDDGWDGLTRYYRGIWEAAGRPDERFHLTRIRAFCGE